MIRTSSSVSACAGLVALLCVSSIASAQVAPTLGLADQFGVLGNSGVTGSSGSGTVVIGDVGSTPTSSITNFPPSTAAAPYTVHVANDAVVQQARLAAIAAYNSLLIQGSGTVLPDNLATAGALGPGIYSFVTGAADLPAGTTLTLNGSGVFIFNVGSSLTANVGSTVVGNANPCNIYWRVGSSATLNGVNFRGTVISTADISLGSSTSLEGRALAGIGATGAITMAGAGGNSIGGCSGAPIGAVPTLPQVFAVVLAAGLVALGYVTLRQRKVAAERRA
ncbi:MAG: ice-binding family protein [Vicinamibacterales bacterium]